MKTIMSVFLALFIAGSVFAEGYEIGDKAKDFQLKNVDGELVSLADYKDAKGFVVIFTCNHCPFAVAWEDRIINLDKKYKEKGYPVIAINSNDEKIVPGDSYENMIVRADEKGFTFPYLRDDNHVVADYFGAMRTPQVYILKKDGKELVVSYIGTIDNNHKDASQVTETYVADALDALLKGKKPDPSVTKAIGCTIKR